jgi:hypothetical protein
MANEKQIPEDVIAMIDGRTVARAALDKIATVISDAFLSEHLQEMVKMVSRIVGPRMEAMARKLASDQPFLRKFSASIEAQMMEEAVSNPAVTEWIKHHAASIVAEALETARPQLVAALTDRLRAAVPR